MEQLLETIRAAVAPDASEEAKAAGASACRSILALLEPSSSTAATPITEAPAINPNIVALATAIRGIPIDQLLDLAIAKLRTALPAGTEVPMVPPLRLPLVPVPRR